MKWVLATVSLLVLILTPAQAQDDEARIVAIGDLHGDYEAYIEVLQMAGLLSDNGRRWTGGNTILVQLGDVLDRGPEGVRILEHLADLENKARRRGGMVYRLAGNHEAMHVTGDLRYVAPEEYEQLIDRRSERRRADFFDRMVASCLLYTSPSPRDA